jgi:CheY-like chemotaxis protein
LVLLSALGEGSRPSPIESADFAVTLYQPVKPAQLRDALLQAVEGPQQPAKATAPTLRLDVNLAQRQPLRILLVDDNPINLKVAVRLFKQFGYRADLASNGQEALEAVERLPYDVVFMDVQMPEMDGLEATRRIRQWEQGRAAAQPGAPRTIIIAMTANAMAGDREACLTAGMDDYIAKPVRPETLSAALEHWGKQVGRKADTAFAVKPLPAAQKADALPPVSPPAASAAPSSDSPVDLGRMTELAGGSLDGLRELVELYCRQTISQFTALQQAIQSGNAAELKRVAHSCGGASATCGILALVPLLRELERLGHEGRVAEAPSALARAQAEFGRLKDFLLDHFRRHGSPPPKV